jgi:hypothetical protein
MMAQIATNQTAFCENLILLDSISKNKKTRIGQMQALEKELGLKFETPTVFP